MPPAHPEIHTYAKRLRSEFSFNSSSLPPAENAYVAWLDLMGAGQLMSISVQRAANNLARLHMAVDDSVLRYGNVATLLPINDGVFIVSQNKTDIAKILRDTMALLASFFIATPKSENRFLIRSAVAYGPVYRGKNLLAGIKSAKVRTSTASLERVIFGHPIIQAYSGESLAVPFGVYIHESARAFSPPGEKPFQSLHWLWWDSAAEAPHRKGLPPLGALKATLHEELSKYLDWLALNTLQAGIGAEKVQSLKRMAGEYFKLS